MFSPKRPSPTWKVWLALVLLYGLLAGNLTSLHAFAVNFGPKEGMRAERHALIVSMEGGDKPWAYRVGVPMAVEHPLRDIAKAVGAEDPDAREYPYLVIRFLATFLVLLQTHLLIEVFASRRMAMVGALWVAALHGPSFEHYWFQPASEPDHALWLTAALLTIRRRDRWLFPLLLLASLIRETSIFIVALHVALRWKEEHPQRTVLRALALAVVWAGPFLWLREVVVLGPPEDNHNVAYYLKKNLFNFEWIWYAFSFVGPWIILPLLGIRHVPPQLRRMMAVLVPYIVLVFAFGRIREVRLWLPLTVAWVPAAVVVLNQWVKDEANSRISAR